MFDEQTAVDNPFAQGAIQDSIFWTIYQESMDPVLLVGLDNRILDCNQATLQQLRLNGKTQLIGRNIGDFSPPTQPDGSDSVLKAAEYATRLTREGSIRFEWTHQRADGSPFEAELTCMLVPWQGQSISYTQMRDISEHKYLLNTLRESEEAARRIFEHEADPVVIFRDGVLVDFNQAAIKALGFDSREAMREVDPIKFSATTQADGRPTEIGLAEMIAEAWQGKTNFSWRMRRRNGEEFDAQITVTAIKINGRDVLHIRWQDMSEQQRLLKKLRDSEESARLIFEEAADAVLIFRQGVVVDCNKAAVRQLGYPAKPELLGKGPLDMAAPVQPDGRRSADLAARLIGEAMQKGSITFEWLLRRKDETTFLVDFTLTAINLHGEDILHIRWRDLTEERRLLQKLRESEESSRRIFEEAADPVVMFRRGLVFDCNKAALQQLGYADKAELIGQSPIDMAAPIQANGQSAAELAATLIGEAMRSGNKSYGWLLRRKDGSIFEVEFTMTSIVVNGEDVLHIRWHDVSELRRLANELRESEDTLRRVFEEAASPLLLFKNGIVFDANRAAAVMLGYADARLIAGKTPEDMTPLGDIDRAAASRKVHEMVERTLRDGYAHFDWLLQRQDGSTVETEMTLTRISIRGELVIHTQIRDLTEQNRLQAALHAEKERAEITLASIGDAVMTTDAAGRVTFLNHVAAKLTGWTVQEVLGQPADAVFHIVNEQTRERQPSPVDTVLRIGKPVNLSDHTLLLSRDGKEYVIEDSAAPIFLQDGTLLGCVLVFHDVTEKHELLQNVHWQAGHDALTGLPNRALLADRFERALAAARRQGNLLGVCLMDLDQFKPVNDLYGHNVGDRLLIEVAERMKVAVRNEDTIARLGGDEFVILLSNLEDAAELEIVLQRILDAVAKPYAIEGHSIGISASLGVAIYPLDNADADTLLRHADQAMYQAKQAGRNRFQWFDVAEDKQTQTVQQTLAQLRHALADNQLQLYYQPKVDMRSGEIVGMEALLRWRHPERGLVPPGEFLPAAEQTDLIVDIGEWVIEQALIQIGTWLSAGKAWPVSVNIAARHFHRPDFLDRLKDIFACHPTVPARLLEIEILESVALGDINYIRDLIVACQALGVKFSLDDFGTGYSSLSYLKRLPADTLKIDQSFVRDMLDDQEDLALIEAVIGLSKAFDRRVVAEGVETVEHGVLLMRLGCAVGQGYGIARPMPADGVLAWAATFTPDAQWLRWADVPWDMRDLPLLMARQEHVKWVEQVLDTVAGRPLAMSRGQLTDCHQCRFGRWYDGVGRERYGHFPEFAAIAAPHAEAHRIGAEMIRRHRVRDDETAHQMGSRLLALKTEILALLDNLQRKIHQHVSTPPDFIKQ